VPKPPDILIVEDDPATYKALPALLGVYGFTTELVNNVTDALEAIKKEPKFLLLDLKLVGGNGIEVLKYLNDNNLKTKCAVTTAYLNDETALLGYPVLMKPIELEKLLDFLSTGN
jgi:DNA-binding NtrC family response regulator